MGDVAQTSDVRRLGLAPFVPALDTRVLALFEGECPKYGKEAILGIAGSRDHARA